MKQRLLLTILLLVCLSSFLSQDYVKNIIKISDTIEDPEKKIGFLLDNFSKCQGASIDECVLLIDEAERLNENFKNLKAKAGIASLRAYYHQMKKNQKNAISYFLKAEGVYNKLDSNDARKSFVYNGLSTSYMELCHFDSSVYWIWKAIYFSQRLGDSASVAGAYSSLASIYESENNYTLAEEFNKRAIGTMNYTIDHIEDFSFSYDLTMMNGLMSTIICRYGHNLIENGKVEQGLAEMLKADKMEVPDYYRLYIKTNLAEAYINSEVYNSALTEAHKAIDLCVSFGIVDMENLNKLTVADALLNLNKVEEASQYLKQVYENKDQLGENKIWQSRLFRLMSTLNENLKDYELALKHTKIADSIDQVIYKTKNDKIIKSLQIKFQTTEQQLANELLREDNIKKEETNSFLWLIVAGLILATLIFITLLIRNKVLNNRLNKQKNQLTETLKKNMLLNREINHRVKNNLQMIIGLLDLQAVNIESDQAKEIIEEGKKRINSVAILHQKLYNQDNINEINFIEYCHLIADQYASNYSTKLNFIISKKDFIMDIDQAVPLSIILNELITNSIKHAFKNKNEGEISINIENKDNNILFSYSDNGSGVIEENSKNNSNSLGSLLIEELGKQLKGEKVVENKDGFKYALKFSKLTI